jgi:hypothetical protein
MDHQQFVKEYRGGRDPNAGEVVLALGLLWQIFLSLEGGASVTDPNPPPPPASPQAHPGS